jgi:hypothetical protein
MDMSAREQQPEIGRVHTAAIFACRPGGIGVAPFPLDARRVATERDEGGPGGFREGVGKTEGLGEAGRESDMVDERKKEMAWDLKAKADERERDGMRTLETRVIMNGDEGPLSPRDRMAVWPEPWLVLSVLFYHFFLS